MAAKQQEDEAGDMTNLVITLAGELMVQAETLLKMGLHPSEILIGYEKAAKKVLNDIEDLSCYTVNNLRDKDEMYKCVKTSVASKVYGNENKMAQLITDACIYALPKNIRNFNVDNIRVQKILGGGLNDSEVVHGLVIIRASETSITKVLNAKIAVFNTNIEMQQGETKGTVLLKNADDLMNYTKSEEDKMEAFIKKLAECGINVVVATGAYSDVSLHFLEKYHMMAIKIMSKFEVKRIAKTTGAGLMVKLDAPTPDEIGTADEVVVTEISSQKCTIIRRNEEENRIGTIVLKGSTISFLDDAERAVDDGVNTVKCLAKDGRMLAGAGATEIHLASMIQTYAKTQPGLDQYAVEKFGEAFEVIPRTLAENAGLNAEEIIAKLYSETAKSPFFGIDVEDGKVKDVKEDHIFDCLEAKTWAIKLTIDVVLTILKVDQIIMSKPAGGPKPRDPQAPDLD